MRLDSKGEGPGGVEGSSAAKRAEHEARLAALGDMETTTPELNAVAMVRIDATASTDRGGLA